MWGRECYCGDIMPARPAVPVAGRVFLRRRCVIHSVWLQPSKSANLPPMMPPTEGYVGSARAGGYPRPHECQRLQNDLVVHADMNGLLRSIGQLGPLVEAGRGDQAARILVRVAEARLRCDCFGAGVMRLPILWSFAQNGTRPQQTCDSSRLPSRKRTMGTCCVGAML